MKTQTIILLLATLSTGLMAGIFFTWSNAVTTGIGQLSDIEYLKSFQAMNRTILNPIFFLIIFSPVTLLPVSSILYYQSSPKVLFWVILVAGVIYLIGVIAITFFGNVPLNIILDKIALDSFSLEEAKSLRSNFENKWNFFNWIRTYSSIGSFLLLIITCITGKT